MDQKLTIRERTLGTLTKPSPLFHFGLDKNNWEQHICSGTNYFITGESVGDLPKQTSFVFFNMTITKPKEEISIFETQAIEENSCKINRTLSHPRLDRNRMIFLPKIEGLGLSKINKPQFPSQPWCPFWRFAWQWRFGGIRHACNGSLRDNPLEQDSLRHLSKNRVKIGFLLSTSMHVTTKDLWAHSTLFLVEVIYLARFYCCNF